jgi:hypothetical protein
MSLMGQKLPSGERPLLHKADLVLQWQGMGMLRFVTHAETGSDISFARLRHTYRLEHDPEK